MKTVTIHVLCCVLVAACTQKETQLTNSTTDTTQAPATTTSTEIPDEPEEEINPSEQHALAVIDSITQGIADNNSIPPSIRILTEKLFETDPADNDDWLLHSFLPRTRKKGTRKRQTQ